MYTNGKVLQAIPLSIANSAEDSTKNKVLKCSWTHAALSLPKSGDRYPLGPPVFTSCSSMVEHSLDKR